MGLFAKLSGEPERREAVAALKHLRSSIDEFHRLRMLNQCALRGTDRTCKYKPEEMRARLQAMRDPMMEQRFQDEHYRLMSLLYQREPTQEELLAGPPSGDALGLLPALLAVGVPLTVIGSAWGLSSITNYLSGIERRGRGESETAGATSALNRLLQGVVVVAGLGGAAYGGYKLLKWAKGKPQKKELKEAEEEEAPELPEAEEEEEETSSEEE